MGDIEEKETEKIIELLEYKITEWELDRSEDKINHERKMVELLKRVSHIKATSYETVNVT